jgi:hypothetical protein
MARALTPASAQKTYAELRQAEAVVLRGEAAASRFSRCSLAGAALRCGPDAHCPSILCEFLPRSLRLPFSAASASLPAAALIWFQGPIV